MYVTFYRKQKSFVQLSMQEMLERFYADQAVAQDPVEIQDYYNTFTIKTEKMPVPELPQDRVSVLIEMSNALHSFNDHNRNLYRTDRDMLYTSFLIPKRSGGTRQIDAPCEDLKAAQRELKHIFEDKCLALSHNTAYAYVKGRSCKHALQRHQHNQSRWFLKLDIKDFFPSCDKSFLRNQLNQIYPFCYLEPVVDRALDLCLLHDSLPQGTPMSPLLTNLAMLPIDYEIQQTLKDYMNNYFVYTRYADDILISCKYDFRWEAVQAKVEEIFQKFNAPFVIKKEKTRYGSSAGRNWNLGLMLNKDNQITIGHKQKERLKAMLFNFLKDYKSGTLWEVQAVRILQGQLSYYKNIEPDYVRQLEERYNEKLNLKFSTCFKNILTTDRYSN